MSEHAAADVSSPPPRPIGAAARRQATREVAVRTWLLITFGVALVVVVVGYRNVNEGLADRRLRASGVRVEALIEGIGGGTDHNADRTNSKPVTLSFQMPGEAERRTVSGTSSPMPGRFSVRDTIPIWIDPYDSKRWTDRVESPGWLSLLAVPLLLAPLVVALGALTIRRRGRFVRTYRDGTWARGSVVEVQTSALAPGQKVLRVALPDRTVAVTRPDRLGPVAPGDAADVIVDARGRAVLAAAYA